MIDIFPAEQLGHVKPLNGVNLGPIERHWARNYTEQFREIGISSVRTHDASLFVADVVDLHCVFPVPTADPDDPDNYDFGLTDAYLRSILDTGADIYLRLGESIDHTPYKRYVNTDLWTAQQLARVCVNIVRHVNDGWADGHHWGISYVEFWNEPEALWSAAPDRRQCWSGTPEQFTSFYSATSAALKSYDPSLKVGLAGFTQEFTEAWLAAGSDREAIGGWAAVVTDCIASGSPIDFVSWHYYGESLEELVTLAQHVRSRLDELGLEHAESHITEWHFVPQLSDESGAYNFMAVRLTNNYNRIEAALAANVGPTAAAFTFGAMARLQEAGVDLAHHYTGIGGNWGLFEFSGRPNGLFHAFAAFHEFTDGMRIATRGGDEADPATLVAFAVVRSDGRVKVGIANLGREADTVVIGMPGSSSPSYVYARSYTESGWTAATLEVRDGQLEVPTIVPGITVLDFDRVDYFS